MEQKGFEPATPTPHLFVVILRDFGRVFGLGNRQKRSGEFNRRKFASDFSISVPSSRPTGNLELRTGFTGAAEQCVVTVGKGG